MGSVRAATARSAADRELHGHIGRAIRYVRSAMDVCVRVGRSRHASDASVYREQQRRLKLAARLLSTIGFVDPEDTDEMRMEARALCSWLESRERRAGIKRQPRRGSEYQARLQQVLSFLAAVSVPETEEWKPVLPFEPQDALVPLYGPAEVIDD